jgi:hypothetical protein
MHRHPQQSRKAEPALANTGVPNTQAAPAVAEIFRKVRLELMVFIIVLGRE